MKIPDKGEEKGAAGSGDPLASPAPRRHSLAMPRSILPAALALTLAACSATPPPVALPQAPSPPVAPRTGLSGSTQAQLAARFGAPSFVLREGPGLKLQWQNMTCVLDAYLYPPASGAGLPTVAHVDTRRPGSGDSVPVEGCAASLTRN